jgi:hypothetical protein
MQQFDGVSQKVNGTFQVVIYIPAFNHAGMVA